MLINALRFRDFEGPWQAYRFAPGTGRFRNYLCAAGDAALLRRAAAAVELALTGRLSPIVSDVEMIVSDDAGTAWTIRREPGFTLILRDNQPVTGKRAERELLSALLDIEDAQRFEMGSYIISAQDEGLKLVRLEGGNDDSNETLRIVAERQVREVANACARVLDLPAAANPAVLAKLGRALEPLYAAYRELVAQYHELKDTHKTGETTRTQKADADITALTAELDLIRQISDTSQPLLAPGISAKAWRDDLQKTESKIAEIVVKHGLGAPESARCPADLRKPIEALARLDAYARLLRASQGARKQCETEIEPLIRDYLALGERCMDHDQKIIGELESCLEALSLKLAATREEPRFAPTDDDITGTLKTWFDRFRSRQQAAVHAHAADGPSVLDDIASGAAAELETARMTVAFARTRLEELGNGLGTSRPKFQSVLRRFDDTHDELVKTHAKLKEQWRAAAEEQGLPETMNLGDLVQLLGDYAELTALLQRRDDLTAKVRDAAARFIKLAQLIPDWRRCAQSQKAADLSSHQSLLIEARDIVRYREAKEKRLLQLTQQRAEANAEDRLRAILRTRRKELSVAWRQVFEEQKFPAIDLSHDGLPEFFRRTSLVRALGLVIGSGLKGTETRPFDTGANNHAASVYFIDEPRTSNPTRLCVLEALENASGDNLRLLLVADEGLAAMLGSLGIGIAARAQNPDLPLTPALAAAAARATTAQARNVEPRPTSVPSAAPTSSDQAPRTRTPTVTPPATVSRPMKTTPAAPLLSDRAQQALDLLKGGRKS